MGGKGKKEKKGYFVVRRQHGRREGRIKDGRKEGRIKDGRKEGRWKDERKDGRKDMYGIIGWREMKNGGKRRNIMVLEFNSPWTNRDLFVTFPSALTSNQLGSYF